MSDRSLSLSLSLYYTHSLTHSLTLTLTLTLTIVCIVLTHLRFDRAEQGGEYREDQRSQGVLLFHLCPVRVREIR